MDAWRHHQARPQRENKLAMCPVWTVVYPVGGTKMKTREELEQNVREAEDVWKAGYSVRDGQSWCDAWDALWSVKDTLRDYDEENT